MVLKFVKRKLTDGLLALKLCESDFRKDVKKTIRENNLIADTLQYMIISGRYNGTMMCINLGTAKTDGCITREAYKLTTEYIQKHLYGRILLGRILLNDAVARGDDYVLEAFDFSKDLEKPLNCYSNLNKWSHAHQLATIGSRMIKTKWYWERINNLRVIAAEFEKSLPNLR